MWADEIWSFCYAKACNAPNAEGVIDAVGDMWTWTAIDRDTKLIVSWLVSPRSLSEDSFLETKTATQ